MTSSGISAVVRKCEGSANLEKTRKQVSNTYLNFQPFHPSYPPPTEAKIVHQIRVSESAPDIVARFDRPMSAQFVVADQFQCHSDSERPHPAIDKPQIICSHTIVIVQVAIPEVAGISDR